MEFADAHFAHQDPNWLSHTHQYVEWYKRNKANYESAYFVLHSKKLGVKKKKKSHDDDCLLSVNAQGVLCITPVSYWKGTWSHQQQSGFISSFHWPLAPCCDITELHHQEWLRKRTLNNCYLHILLPEQWGPTWSWHSIHTSAGPWRCAPGRQEQKGKL